MLDVVELLVYQPSYGKIPIPNCGWPVGGPHEPQYRANGRRQATEQGPDPQTSLSHDKDLEFYSRGQGKNLGPW